MSKEKTYTAFWKSKLPAIKIQLKNSINGKKSIALDKSAFLAAGNRKGYSFMIRIRNGKLDNYPTGSVVGDNLYEVLSNDIDSKQILLNRVITIKMGDDFVMWIETVLH